jgi:lipopolysaccharide export LptBFGC system permease protein LptF
MKNLTLLHIIKNFEEQTIIAFVTVKNPVTKAVSVLDKMIEDIRVQNEEIEGYFEQLLQYKNNCIQYNRDIIKTIEMFQRYQKEEERIQLQENSWESEKQVNEFFAKKVQGIKNQIQQFKKFYFKCKEDFVGNIHLDLKKNLTKLSEEMDTIVGIPEISGIIRLNRNVKTAIDVYSDTQRKY